MAQFGQNFYAPLYLPHKIVKKSRDSQGGPKINFSFLCFFFFYVQHATTYLQRLATLIFCNQLYINILQNKHVATLAFQGGSSDIPNIAFY